MDEFIPIIDSTPTPLPPLPPAVSTSCPAPEHLMYKNRLQEYTQRQSLQLPIYQTVNEGYPHDPKFRSTVLVDGEEYTSHNTFSHRKEAEQDVAKLALTSITEKIKDEIKDEKFTHEDTVACKSILNEYAVKMQLEMPTYNTVKQGGLFPIFVSSSVFNGVTYNGDMGRTKKEAEQLAARAAVLSLLRNVESGEIISKFFKSKRKLYVGFHKSDSQDAQNSNMPVVGKDIKTEALMVSNVVPIPEAASALHPPHHEFTKTKPEKICEGIDLPIAFVHPVSGQSVDVALESGKKRRKNKKKPNKKLRSESQLPVDAVPLNQAAPYSVAS
ncbi:double-stranded RNA-binding protein 4 isoform X1 [Ricinus communis]|uniref:double-stranded RNA-binding protein 4 isoform X1 n=1 Tax=Ricinus communis TaxID=3988 RepID=UPI00201AB619|nr:double-stranded RNA-binding protein 4 isoform X1 [Ricinus communis]